MKASNSQTVQIIRFADISHADLESGENRHFDVSLGEES